MNTPIPKHFCPQCRAAFAVDQNFCGRCGSDMQHASGLKYRAQKSPQSPDLGRDDSLAQGSGATGQTNPMRESWTSPITTNRRSSGRDPWLGRTIDNRYKVLEVVGRGGMGVVYKVEHQRMGKIAAMKVLHGDLAEDPEIGDRFRREAEAVSRLNHPNTVQVFDFGNTEGALYLIMEYVRGFDLGSLISRDGPLPFERAAPLFGQICSALGEAHELGVIHRDLKPENVLVTRTHGGRDFVKVLDFGLAKLSEREDDNDVTDRGSIVGTPYYMSPEQIRGEVEVDQRTDVYSLGALMYKVLTGEPAFTAKSPVGVLTRHLTATLVPPSERVPELGIDERVDAIVGKAMAKQREDRYSSAGELLADLEETYRELEESNSRGLPGLSLSTFAGSSTSRKVAASSSLADDEVDWGMDSDIRLQRGDIDAFESSIKRRRWLRVAIVPLMLAAMAGAFVYWFMLRTEPPRTAELEPNNSLEQATPIEAATDVSGFIGKRINKTKPDRDLYRVVTPPGSDAVVTISVSGVPNMDLAISLYDSTGNLLHERNEHGIGGDETIRSWQARQTVFVSIDQIKSQPQDSPIENVSDAYRLRVELAAAVSGAEVEPNDDRSDAQPLAVGATLTGYLDRREDADSYQFSGAAGSYTLKLGGASSVPLRWRINNGPWRTERQSTIALAPQDLLQLARSDANTATPQNALPGAAEPYALELH